MMDLKDFQRLFKNAKLPIDSSTVAEAFGMGKMTVIKENDSLEQK